MNPPEYPVYKTMPSIEMISERVEKYHDAFHHKIDELKPRMKFLIDGHFFGNGKKPTWVSHGTLLHYLKLRP